MGENWKLIGYETSEQLAVIQRQHYVVVTKRAKYAPVNERVTGGEQGIKIAVRPDQILPKSIADASVIADVVRPNLLMACRYIDRKRFTNVMVSI